MMSSATATQTQMNAASTPPMGSWQQQSMQTQSSNQQMVSMQPPTYFLPPGMAAGLMSMPQQQQQQPPPPPPPPPPAPHHHHHFQPHPFGTMMARAPVVYSMMSSGGGVPNGGNTFTQVQMEGFMHAAQGTPSWMPPTLPMHPNRLSHGGNAPPTVVVGFQNQQGQAAGTPTTTATTPGNNTGASMRSPPLRPNGPPMMLVSSAGSGVSPPSVSPSHGSPSFPAIPVSYGIPIPQPLNSFDSNHRRMGNSSGDSDSSRNSRREAAVKKHSLLKSRGELNTAKTGGQQQQQQQQVSGDHLFLASSNNASVSSSRNAVSPSVGFMGSSFALCNASAASGGETDGGGGGLLRLHDGDTGEGPSRRRLAIPVLVPDGDGLETTSSVTPASSPHRRSIMNLDEHRVAQRQKQIRFGKVTKGYLHYRLAVPTFDREVGNEDHPETPHATSECSKRKWDSHVAQWRRKLHVWDTMTSDDAPLQLSKGLPRRQDLGLERPTSRIEYYARTYAEIDRVKDEVTTMYQHGHDSDAIASEVPAETAGSQILGGRTAPAQHQAGSYSDTHPSTPGLTTTTTTTPGNSLAWAAAPMHDQQQQQQQHGGGRGGGISSSALPLLRLPESVPIDGSTSGLVVAPLQPTTMMGEHDMMSMVAPQHSSDSLAWQEGVMSAMMAQSLPPSKVEAIFANEDAHVADVTKEFVGGEGDTEVDGDSVHAVTQLPTMLPPSQSTTPSQGGAISGTNISNTQFEFSVLDEFRGKGGRVPPTPLSPMGCHESPIRPGGQRPPTGGGHSLNRSNFPVFSGALEQTLTPPSSSALGLLAASSRTPDDKLLNRPSSGRSWQRPSEGGSSGGGASAKKALRSPPRPRSSNSASGVFGSGMSLVNRTLSSPLSTALDQQQHSPLAAFADGTTTQSLLDSPQQSILREGRQFMIVYLDGSVSNSSQPDRKERVGSAGKHRGNGGGQQPSSAFSQQQTDVSPCESCVVPATTTAAPRTSPGVDVSPASATTTPSSFERGRDTLVVARPSELIKCLQQAHFDLDKMTFVDPPSAIQLHLPVSPGMLIAPGVSERPLSTIEDVSKWLEVYRDVPIPFMFYRDRIPSFKDTPMLWMSEDNMNASNGGDMLILQNPPSATKQRANNAAHRARDNSLITSAIAMQTSFAYCATNNNSSLAFVNGVSNASMTALHTTAGGGGSGSGPRTTTPHHLTLGGMVDEGMMLTFYPSQATMTMSPIACLDAAKLTAGSFYSVPPSQLAMGGGGGGTFEFASSSAATASGGMRLDATPTTAASAVAAGASLTSLTTHSSPVVVLDGSASPEGSHHSTTHSSRRRTSSPGLLDATLNGDIIPSPSAKSRHVNESGSHFGGGDTLWM